MFTYFLTLFHKSLRSIPCKPWIKLCLHRRLSFNSYSNYFTSPSTFPSSHVSPSESPLSRNFISVELFFRSPPLFSFPLPVGICAVLAANVGFEIFASKRQRIFGLAALIAKTHRLRCFSVLRITWSIALSVSIYLGEQSTTPFLLKIHRQKLRMNWRTKTVSDFLNLHQPKDWKSASPESMRGDRLLHWRWQNHVKALIRP